MIFPASVLAQMLGGCPAVVLRLPCGCPAVVLWFPEVLKRRYDVGEKATGKDFNDVTLLPHVVMMEADRIFGWNYPKFKKSSLKGVPGALSANLLERDNLPHPGGRYGVQRCGKDSSGQPGIFSHRDARLCLSGRLIVYAEIQRSQGRSRSLFSSNRLPPRFAASQLQARGKPAASLPPKQRGHKGREKPPIPPK